MNNICTIVITYNVGLVYRQNFLSLVNQVEHIIIIDNNSDLITKNLLTELKNSYPQKLTVIFNSSNLGIAEAQNIGIKKANELKDFAWLLFLDHDSCPEQQMINKMLRFYDSYQNKDKVAILGAVHLDLNDPEDLPTYLISYPNRSPIKWRKIKKDDQDKYLSVWFNISSGSLIRPHVFKEIGLFREDFFIDYVDIEFCFRLKSKSVNSQILIVRDASFYHQLGNKEIIKFTELFKIKIYNYTTFRKFYYYCNRIKFSRIYFNYYPRFIIQHFIGMILSIVRVILFERQRLASTKAIIRGLIAGIHSRL